MVIIAFGGPNKHNLEQLKNVSYCRFLEKGPYNFIFFWGVKFQTKIFHTMFVINCFPPIRITASYEKGCRIPGFFIRRTKNMVYLTRSNPILMILHRVHTEILAEFNGIFFDSAGIILRSSVIFRGIPLNTDFRNISMPPELFFDRIMDTPIEYI